MAVLTGSVLKSSPNSSALTENSILHAQTSPLVPSITQCGARQSRQLARHAGAQDVHSAVQCMEASGPSKERCAASCQADLAMQKTERQ